MEQLLVEYDDKLSLLLSPGTPSNETRVTTETINGLMRAIRPMADFIILDLPRTWDSWVIDLLASTDELVLVGKPDLANLRNGKSMVEFLGSKRGTDSPTRLVLNQVGEVKKRNRGRRLQECPRHRGVGCDPLRWRHLRQGPQRGRTGRGVELEK